MNAYYDVNTVSYDKIAAKWDDFRKTCDINKCVEEFADLLSEGAVILDAGCGTGVPIAKYLTNRGFSVVGIDPSSEMIKRARALRLKSARFTQCGFLDFETEEKFDAVIAFDSLWYIPVEDQPKIYEKASSLLKDGGLFMFSHGKEHGSVQGGMFGADFVYFALSLREVESNLKDNGFVIQREDTDYAEPTTGTRDLLVFAKKALKTT